MDKAVTRKDVIEWFDDLEDSLKRSIMGTALDAKEAREEIYNLYQAAQLLRARLLGDMFKTVDFQLNMYDEPTE